MGESAVKYRSMPGNWFSPTKLWMGADYLLLTGHSFFREECRRFYFSDIQAIIIRKTASGMVSTITLYVLACLVLLITLTTMPTHPVMWFIFIILVLLLARNIIGGPTCECHLRTAANLQRIPSIRRIKKAQKLLDIIRPAIRRTQGEVSDEDLRRQLTEADAQGPPIGQPPGTQPFEAYAARGQGPPKLIRAYKSKIHQILFLVLLAGCAVDCITFVIPVSLLVALCLLVVLAELGLTIAAMVKQRHTDLPQGIRTTVGFSLGYICLFYVVAAYGNIVIPIALDRPPVGISFFDSEGFVKVLAGYGAICSGTLGLIGTFQFAAFRRRRERPSADAAPADTVDGSPQRGRLS